MPNRDYKNQKINRDKLVFLFLFFDFTFLDGAKHPTQSDNKIQPLACELFDGL